MQNQKYSRFKTISNTLSSVSASIPSSIIFALDSLSLLLFSMGILCIMDTFPDAAYFMIRTTFIVLTSFLTLVFLHRRIFPMVILKLSMLFILCALDAHIY